MTVLDKVELRASMRRRRKELAASCPDAGARAVAFVADLPPASPVAVYHAMAFEIDVEPLALALIQEGRVLCLPVVERRDAPLVFRRWTIGDPLEMDAGGCAAPLPLAEVMMPELILTPLLAFDDTGTRLGQGGGYYDRTFAAFPHITRIGIAYAGQRVERLPIEPHDIRLHGVLTEAGVRQFQAISL